MMMNLICQVSLFEGESSFASMCVAEGHYIMYDTHKMHCVSLLQCINDCIGHLLFQGCSCPGLKLLYPVLVLIFYGTPCMILYPINLTLCSDVMRKSSERT